MFVALVIMLGLAGAPLGRAQAVAADAAEAVEAAEDDKGATQPHSVELAGGEQGPVVDLGAYPLEGKASIEQGEHTGAHSAVLARRIPYEMSQVYEVLSDYKNFPEYMPHTVKSEVIKTEGPDGSVKWVDYTLKFLMMIKVHYTLKLTHELKAHEARITWQMVKGKQFDDILGHWYLVRLAAGPAPGSSVAGQAQAVPWTGLKYVSLIDPKLSIPRPIFNTLTKSSVYELFDAVVRRLQVLTEEQKSTSSS